MDCKGFCGVAILALIAFHVHPSLLPGGFAAIDVLLTVSGYLAMRSIHADLERGAFLLRNYYNSAVQWLLPPLVVMLAAATLAAWATMPSGDLGLYGLTLAAATAFAANIAFVGIGDYTSVATGQPLYHLWALGAGVQVLAVLPLICLALARWRPNDTRRTLAILTVLSYWAAVWALNADAALGWHMPFARAWEVLIGALVVVGELPKLRSAIARSALAAAGLTLIAATFALAKVGDPFPGLPALAPTLGAAMVIHAGASGPNPVSALLGARPLATIGAASYALYLWHWPALTFARRLAEPETRVTAIAVALALTAGAAWLSWRSLERRSDARAIARTRHRTTIAALLGALVLFSLGASRLV